MADNTPVDAECGSGSEEDRKQTAVSSMISPPEVEQDGGGASEELGLAKSAFDNAVIHTSAVSVANATGTSSSSSSSSSATEKDFLSEPALVPLVEQLGSHKEFEITGENNKNTTWEHAHTAVVEIEDKAEHGNASPNTSIHLVYSRPIEIGSPAPPTVASPVLSETAKSINIIDKKQNYYIIRRNRARSLPGDEDDTPAKKMCHR